MRVPFPKSTVWFIQATSADSLSDETASGSAVCVWLKPPASQGDGESTNARRKYLLTCSHAVRGTSKTGRPCAGELLQRVRCWAPGQGFVPPSRDGRWPLNDHGGVYSATVVDVYERGVMELTAADLTPSKDWVLLDVHQASFQEHESVHAWSGEAEEDVQIIGFPAGARTWKPGSIVASLSARDFRQEVPSDSPALTLLTGPEETAPGMSGGGIFNARGEFVGLHRSQSTASRSMGGISARHIAGELNARQYGCVSYERPDLSEQIPKSTHDFFTFLADVRSVQSNVLKLMLAAPLLNLVLKVGPPTDDIMLVSFVIVILQLLVYMTVFVINAVFRLSTRSAAIILAGSIGLSIISLLVYSNAASERVIAYERFDPEMPESSFVERLVIGTELIEGLEPVRDMPPIELMKLFHQPEAIYTPASLSTSKSILRWSWFGIWTFGSFSLGLVLLVFRHDQR